MTFAQQHIGIMLLNAGLAEILNVLSLGVGCYVSALFRCSSQPVAAQLFLVHPIRRMSPTPRHFINIQLLQSPSWAQVVHRTEREHVNSVNT